MIEHLKKALEADPENPFLQGHVEALQMSDRPTPRTDQFTGLAFNACALIKTSRQLERELAEAQQVIAAQKHDPTLYSEIESMDLRELMITTHPETPVV